MRAALRRPGRAEVGYVDDALGSNVRERLLAHLVDCAACRSEVHELRTIRRLLAGSRPPATAPADLSQRLNSITGSQARSHYGVDRSGEPPQACFPASGGSGASAGCRRPRGERLGLARRSARDIAAPATAFAVIDDPSADAQAECVCGCQSPLASDSIGAVMLAGTERLTSAEVLPHAPAGQNAKPESSLTSARLAVRWSRQRQLPAGSVTRELRRSPRCWTVPPSPP